MNILIDGLIIGIMLTCCVWGYKSGFIKMAVSFLKNIVALVVASMFATRLGAFLYASFFKGMFEKMTVKKITQWLGVEHGSELDIGPLLERKHTEFVNFIEKLGFDLETVTEKYNELGESSSDVIVEYIAEPLGVTVSNAVAFIILFVLSVLAIKIVGFILGKIVKLPVLNVTNRLLGLILGVVSGIIFVFIFVALVDVLVPYIRIDGESLAAGSIEEGTMIYRHLVGQTPVGLVRDLLTSVGAK